MGARASCTGPAASGGWSAATAFLKPILKRPNLHLATGAHVERILFEGRRATGLLYSRQGVDDRRADRLEAIRVAHT